MSDDLKLQYQESNGKWYDCDDRTEYFLELCEKNNGVNEKGEIVPAFRATRLLTHDEVVKALQSGEILRNDKEDWYSKCRSYAVIEARIAARQPSPEPEMVKCSCGHTIEAGLVMVASLGTACPDCYDRLSD